MFIRRKKPWEIPEREAVQEEVYLGRRKFLRDAGYLSFGSLMFSGLGSGIFGLFGEDKKEDIIKLPRTPTSGLYPVKRNLIYTLERPITDELEAASYNNFYEFTTGKDVWKHVQAFKARPWTIEITGLVEKPRTYDIDELIRKMPLEERLYRHRCVEAWAMAVPWTGFPMRELLKLARPLTSAKFVRLSAFMNPEWASGQSQRLWQPWPYEEGLTMEEAANELAFIATGIYGHELPAQHGAPMRLIVPWKYGFKSIKSIVRIEFTDKQPSTFWNTLNPDEYGFTSNIDPEDRRQRWPQKTEKMIGTGELRRTILYNGYGEYVAGIYR